MALDTAAHLDQLTGHGQMDSALANAGIGTALRQSSETKAQDEDVALSEAVETIDVLRRKNQELAATVQALIEELAQERRARELSQQETRRLGHDVKRLRKVSANPPPPPSTRPCCCCFGSFVALCHLGVVARCWLRCGPVRLLGRRRLRRLVACATKRAALDALAV